MINHFLENYFSLIEISGFCSFIVCLFLTHFFPKYIFDNNHEFSIIIISFVNGNDNIVMVKVMNNFSSAYLKLSYTDFSEHCEIFSLDWFR